MPRPRFVMLGQQGVGKHHHKIIEFFFNRLKIPHPSCCEYFLLMICIMRLFPLKFPNTIMLQCYFIPKASRVLPTASLAMTTSGKLGARRRSVSSCGVFSHYFFFSVIFSGQDGAALCCGSRTQIQDEDDIVQVVEKQDKVL